MPIEPIKTTFKEDEKERFFFINHETLFLLKIMAEHRFITHSEVEKICGYKMKSWRKLKDLIKAELISSFDTIPSSYRTLYWNNNISRKAYCLTSKGYQFLEKENHLRVFKKFFPSHYKVSSLPHTVASAQTQIALIRDPRVITYFSEHVIESMNRNNRSVYRNSNSDLRPDAEFDYRFDNGKEKRRGVVEIEITKKVLSRYKSKCKEYLNRSDINLVLWVCSEDDIRVNVKRSFDDELKSYTDMFLFVNYRELIHKGLDRCDIVNVDNQKVKNWFSVGRRTIQGELLMGGI